MLTIASDRKIKPNKQNANVEITEPRRKLIFVIYLVYRIQVYKIYMTSCRLNINKKKIYKCLPAIVGWSTMLYNIF